MSRILYRKCQLSKIFGKNVPFLSTPKYISDYLHAFKTSESDPRNHTSDDIGLIYTIDNSVSLDTLFGSYKKSDFAEECITFGETPIIIRKPALEIINCIKNTDFEKPVNRYVIYGKYGSGKRITMLQILHYAYNSGWLLIHLPKVNDWVFKRAEMIRSTSMNGYIDLPNVASDWLAHFKKQNVNLINKLDLRIQNDYKWNIQEENKKGQSLLSLIDHGITRGKYSCDVVNAILNEVKLLAKNGIIKVLVAINDYSLIYQNRPKSKFTLNDVSIISGFKNITKSDWHNGVVVLSCAACYMSTNHTDHLPMAQLTRKGFEDLDPFIPIEVPALTKKEMLSLLTYYRSKKWLASTEGDLELQMLSAGNALTLSKLCGPVY